MADQQILNTVLEVIAIMPVILFVGHMVGSIRAVLATPETTIVEPRTVPAMAAAVTATPARMVIKSEDYARIASQGFEQYVNARTITTAPVEWHRWNIRELRWTATRMGIKGAARMNTAELRVVISALID